MSGFETDVEKALEVFVHELYSQLRPHLTKQQIDEALAAALKKAEQDTNIDALYAYCKEILPEE